ncbi:bifunctional nitrate reductase/sulfite reductase flavoprotein subunit alpha [Skermania piniformis]
MCGYCGVGCGMNLQVSAGKVTSASGRADHPANRGRLCTKGATTADLLNSGGRQTTGLVRADRDAEPVPVSAEVAVAEAGRRLRAIRDEHGPDAIALYLSGQMSLEAQYLATKLAKGYLRTSWVESNSRLCMASAGTGYKQSLGADGPPGSYDDLDHADVFLVIGSNMADCHPILFLRMLDRVKQGATLIVIDPRRTATARKADLHLPIRPGTDLALLNGLLRLLVDADAIDPEFIAAHTDGWAAMPALLAEYPLDLVAELTGLAAADIRRTAELIGGADNWVSLWTMGLNQSTHGTWHTNALCNLHLATGAICRTGSGPFSLTGQPNAMGGREMGYMGPGLPGQRSALDPADRAFAEHIWGLPPDTLRPVAGGGTVEMYRRMAAGEIRAAWIICTNPVASMANRDTVIAGLSTADTVIVQEAFAGTETAAYADVVLPAALWSEAEGVMVNSERTLTHCSPALTPPGAARPDWLLICDIARELGYPDAFDYPDAAAVFAELSRFHNPRTGWDLRGVDYDRLRTGPVQWPAAPGGPARNPIRYRNDGISQDRYTAPDGSVPQLAFATPDRRARFLPRPYLPAAELPDDDYPMLLTTGRLAHQWHTMTKTARVAKLNALDPAPFLQLHPEDAARIGAEPNGSVEVRSRRGRAVLPVAIDDAVRPGVCFAPMHWNDAFGADLAINAVTSDAVDPESLQPEFKLCAVAVTPVAAPVEPPSADSAEPDTDPALAALAAILAPHAMIGPGALDSSEAGFLGGYLTGLRANPPAGRTPTIPRQTPLSPTVRSWFEGVLAGVFATAADPAPDPTTTAPDKPAVQLIWASQTGTAEGYAGECAAALAAAGIAVTVHGAEVVSVADLTGTALFLVATTGDGDAPDNGLALWDALAIAEPGELDQLCYAVLGFGDPAYADFCGFAKKLDARLEHVGATRIADRALCEPDYAATAARWLSTVLAALDPGDSTDTPAPVGGVPAGAAPSYSRTNPLRTTLRAGVRLSGPESAKDVRTFTFELLAAELPYRAGDALGIRPVNRAAVVAEWLDRTGLAGAAPIALAEERMPLVQALTERLDITRITPDLVRFVQDRAPSAALATVLSRPADFAGWTHGRQALDLLAEHPVTASIDDWLAVLHPITPRLYSISSSPSDTPDEVAITTSVVRFQRGDHTRHGLCTGYLAELEPGAEVDVFVQPTRHFRPPEDPDTAAVMIGPGTGVAPFRGFLRERAARGAGGPNWLFFGEQHEACDFYYRDELAELQERGVLTRLDLAFSRDGSERVYVQHRMREHAAELWQWLRRGAHVYVCGDAARMARDVDEALCGIVAEHGQMAPKSARSYLAALAAEQRYVRDVY